MKKTVSIFALVLSGVMVWSCQQGPSQAEKDYQDISANLDSIDGLNDNLMAMHNDVMQNHSQMMQQLMAMPNPDSALIRSLAAHEVMYKEQEATFKKIDEVIAAHEEFEKKHEQGGLTEAEISGQVEQMKKDEEMILDEQEKIDDQLEMMRNEHEKVKEQLNDAGDADAGMDGADQTKMGDMTEK